MIKVLTVCGTRPEAIKMAPVIQALKARGDRVVSRLCVTAQHRWLLDQALQSFSLKPDHDLDVMHNGQSPHEIVARVMDRFQPILHSENPDWVLVQGDTTTTMAAALAANYSGVRVGHIEAGLRTFDKCRPFPEEINRLVVTAVADLHFAPTPYARENLLREGVDEDRVFVTGNPGIDALYQTISRIECPDKNPLIGGLPEDRSIILATVHRRENFGRPCEDVCQAIHEIVNLYPDRVHIVLPVHPNPNGCGVVRRRLGASPNVSLVEPLDYQTLVRLMARCEFVLTDSGGIQEEAPALGKPVLVLRDVTERPEGLEGGSVRLVGTCRDRIVEETVRLLEDRATYERMAQQRSYYGDGDAALRIVASLLGEPVSEWVPELRAIM